MKSKKIYTLIIIGILLITELNAGTINELDNSISELKEQLLKKYDDFNGRYAEFTVNGEWKYRDKVNWLSGFIGGELWQLYEITNDNELKDKALKVADGLLEYAGIDYTHDMGFIFFPTVVKAYKVTGDAKYKNAALKAAKMLAARFNRNGNFIRAWGKLGSTKKAGLMIIDTMMNLELLFWAASEFGLPELYEVAYKHAVVSMNEIVREDYSSYHVVEFDPQTGKVIKKYTHQGFSDESTWARGQAWSIYGFANAYKYTKDERFLNVSKKMADYFISHLPTDFVPYWDLNLTAPETPRDASAAVIAASGMRLLAEVSKTKTDYNRYSKNFSKIVNSVLSNYLFNNSSRKNESGLLLHTVYNYHKDWGIDESFPCGDYYLAEALNKYYKYSKSVIADSESIRQKVNINEDWFYLEDNIGRYNKLYLSEKEWKVIDLPHTWNAFDAVDQEPGYRRGIGWYEKDINIDKIDSDSRYLIEFEGVNLKAEVYVNDKLAGEHIGGYIGFEFDITDFIHEGMNNIRVKADNSIDIHLIPSQKSDFFIFGGITRDVYLKKLPATHFTNFKISTPVVNELLAETEVEAEIRINDSGAYKISAELIDADGNILLKNDDIKNLSSGVGKIKLGLPALTNPVLWSIDNPYLYTIRIAFKKDDELVDEVYNQIGYRWYEFKEHGAFYLNGERVLLRGTHRHEEHAGLGNAMSNKLHRKDITMIKEMGANFIRLAHYPQDPEVYKTCDELGLLIWDELPWCRGGVGDDVWKDNSKRLLKEMIDQNYNHPSIILWSVGNEVYWLPDFPDGGKIGKIREFVKELHDYAHELDPHRLTSIRKFYEGSDLVDVFSPSIWAGWYSGVYKSYGKAIDEAISKYDQFLHAEYGGSSHKGRHTETTITGDGLINPNEWEEQVNQVKVENIAKIGDWSENYIVDLFDWHLSVSEKHKNFTGNAQWAFKDFGTPLRPENALPYINQKGLVDREGNPKDAYYVFKSYWSKSPEFCYIESHTWKERSGKPGSTKEINVFSNCDEVELYVNGVSQGRKVKDIDEFPACGLSWNVKLEEGVNKIKAVGGNDKAVSDSISINYHTSPNGKPEEIVFEKKILPNANYLITAKVVDKDGRTCVDYEQRVYFALIGEGKLLENYGTYTKSSVLEFANGEASIEYKPVPFTESVIEARTQDFKGSWLKIKY